MKKIWHVLLMGSFLISLSFYGCNSFSPKKDSTALPKIVESTTNQSIPGKIIWHDLLTSDPDAATHFYGELLDWSFKNINEQYIEIYNHKRKVGGILRIRPKKERKMAAQWLPALSVENLTQSISTAKSNKGTVINGPLDWKRRGTGALICDPQHAHFLLLKTASGDPLDQEPQMGDWLWDEVWTTNLTQEILFYKAIGQYTNIKKNDHYAILMDKKKWRIGIREIDQPPFAGRWLPIIRVENPSHYLKKVIDLGGTVWKKPVPPENAALISDNTGAFFILQSWDFLKKEKEIHHENH